MTSEQKIRQYFTKHLILPILLCFGLVACNSNDSSNEATTSSVSPTTSDVLTGKITGVKLEGLSYRTATQSGKTSTEGAFDYKAGEAISFFIGDIAVGQSAAKPEVTLFEMLGISDPSTITLGLQTKLKSTATSNYNKRSPKTFQFERLSNLIVFLTAIDADGVFSNGVTIPEQLDTIARGKSLDIIGKQIVEFERQLENSYLLDQAVNEGVWQTKPTLVSPGVALDAFYDSLGVTPEIYTVSKEFGDENSDGTNDFDISHTFDDNGNRVKTHKHSDFSDDEVTTYSYDERGNLIGFYYDIKNDGILDSQQEWAFDAKGQEILNQSDYDGDGVFESRATHEIDYHPDGKVSYKKSHFEMYFQDSGLLSASYTNVDKFSVEGRILYEEQSSTNAPDNETVGSSMTYTLDSLGNRIKVEEDQNLDGVIDVIHTYQYNEENQEIYAASDFNADGKLDSVKTSEYNLEKRELTVSLDNYADGVLNQADGIIDSVRVTNYDSDFNKISDRLDEGNDGIFEEVTTWQIIFDEQGRILSNNQTSTTSPELNTLYTYTFDDLGRVNTRQVVAASPDDSYFLTYSYDDQGRQTSSSLDLKIDGVIDYSESAVFHDSYGGITRTLYSLDSGTTYVESTLYDERGNHIETSSSTANSDVESYATKMTYNSDDMLIKEIIIENGVEYSSTEYQYDDKGELFSKVFTDGSNPSSPTVTTWTYEYVDIKSWNAIFLRFNREWADQ